MRTIVANELQGNKRIDKFLKESFANMPTSALYKALRKRDIKVNGVRVKEDYIVMPGDSVQVYIVDDILDGVPTEAGFKLNKGFSVVYEDNNILLVNKQQGVPVHPDRDQLDNTLIDLVQEYLSQKGEDVREVALCHRLDRNTGGLVILAKNRTALDVVLDKLESKEIKKYYQCLVKGKMEKKCDELKAYLVKDEKKSRVFVSEERTKGALEIITRYRVLGYENDVSTLEVELVTGRTHQIRAHMAYVGHPIVGDGKYGINVYNRSMGAKYQALWAYKLVFDFKGGGMLGYLKGMKFEVKPEFKVKTLQG